MAVKGKCTTRPIRVNIHETRSSRGCGVGGIEVAITVMDSPMRAAAFGITRTTVQRSPPKLYALGSAKQSSWWIWETETPAKMLMSNFPLRAFATPGSDKMVPSSCGLLAKRTTEAERTPWTLLERSTSREGENWERESWIFLADSGRVTQAMKWVGIWDGSREFGREAESGVSRR